MEKDRKKAIQADLDRQIAEKNQRKHNEKMQNSAYEKMMEEHHSYLELKEREREEAKKQKIIK